MKTIKITLKDLIGSIEALQFLYACSLPGKIAYDLSEMINEIEKRLNSYDKVKNEKIRQYGEKEGDTGEYKIYPIKKNTKGDSLRNKKYDEYIKEMKEVEEKEVSIPKVEGITRKLFKNQVNVKPLYFSQLKWLFED